MTTRRLLAPATALLVIQVIHGAIPAQTDPEGYVGLVADLLLLIASVVAVYGVATRKSWDPPCSSSPGLSSRLVSCSTTRGRSTRR